MRVNSGAGPPEVKFRIEVKIGKHWKSVHPVKDKPFIFDSQEVALSMARALFPEQFSQQARDGEEVVRVVPVPGGVGK